MFVCPVCACSRPKSSLLLSDYRYDRVNFFYSTVCGQMYNVLTDMHLFLTAIHSTTCYFRNYYQLSVVCCDSSSVLGIYPVCFTADLIERLCSSIRLDTPCLICLCTSFYFHLFYSEVDDVHCHLYLSFFAFLHKYYSIRLLHSLLL